METIMSHIQKILLLLLFMHIQLPATLLGMEEQKNRATKNSKHHRQMRYKHQGAKKLFLAVHDGDQQKVNQLLTQGVSPNIKYNNYSPLENAISQGHVEIVKQLLEKGADVTMPTRCGDSAMSEAVFYGHRKIVELLIGHGAATNVKNKYGYIPSEWAYRRWLKLRYPHLFGKI